jgi:hypothetical protein
MLIEITNVQALAANKKCSSNTIACKMVTNVYYSDLNDKRRFLQNKSVEKKAY